MSLKQQYLKVASIQMVSSEHFSDNLAVASRWISEAAKQGAKLIVLPEYFTIMALKEVDKFDYVEHHGQGVMQDLMKRLAKEYAVWIIAGSHPIASEDPRRPFGRCYVFNSEGEQVAWYDKIHLFDVTVGDSQNHYCESRYTQAGERVVAFDTPWGKVGLAICYDIRFPELFAKLQQQGCQLFVLPAAFTFKTGAAHWDILTRARAVENLCYMVTSAQGGVHANGRQTWGHSSIISPWGEMLDELADGEGLVIAELDLFKLQQIRKEFPVLEHKRI